MQNLLIQKRHHNQNMLVFPWPQSDTVDVKAVLPEAGAHLSMPRFLKSYFPGSSPQLGEANEADLESETSRPSLVGWRPLLLGSFCYCIISLITEKHTLDH